MSIHQIIMLLFHIFGGLALFIFGMNVLTDGLKNALGAKLQRILAKTTRSPHRGFALGIGMGAVMHSAPTIVLLMGFVNAGLMTLEQTIAPILGANIGTTLSMQAVSFHINEYCYVAITAGLFISLISNHHKVKHISRSLFGFGLLFLGMNVMSAAIEPQKDILKIYLQGINGDTYSGILFGVILSTFLTALWQSSGATIAIIFAFISAGLFTQISQVFPIVLGSHIGTCITAIISSFGTHIEARRTALAHFIFNLLNVLLAILAKPLFFYIIPLTSSDLTRQTANLHTLVMVLASLFILPMIFAYAKLLRKIYPSHKAPPESSHLDYDLIEYPERAIVSVIKELQRVSKLCARSLHQTARVILREYDKTTITKIKMNEKIIDDIKAATREYLWTMTQKYLSRRQIIMTHHLNKCMSDIERIGDHIDELCDLWQKRNTSPDTSVDKESFDGFFTLYEKANKILIMVIKSLNPNQDDFQQEAAKILEAREDYLQCSIQTRDNFFKKVERHEVSSVAALYYGEFITVMDRMIKHIESIALAQKHEDFWIKRSKLDKKTRPPDKANHFSDINPSDYLEKLKTDDTL